MVSSSGPVISPRLFSFIGGVTGEWRVRSSRAVVGEPLPEVAGVSLVAGPASGDGAAWVLRGATSNERYTTRAEKTELVAKQEGLGRARATCAALIPIRKNAAWWTLTQDERRQIFEEQSAHVRIGMDYLPAIARRLHHCRDLGVDEPFDFITWFEFAPEHEPAFDAMLVRLRASPEWKFIEREVDIRLER